MNRLIITCICFFTCLIAHAQQKPSIDATIDAIKSVCENANQTYLTGLNAKKLLIVEKASPTLTPFIEFIDSETSYLGGEHTQKRTILSSSAPEDKRVISRLRDASITMFTALFDSQKNAESTKADALKRLQDLAAKERWSESQLQLAVSTVKNISEGAPAQAQGENMVLSVREIKIAASLLTVKGSKVFYLELPKSGTSNGASVGATPAQSLEIAKRQFPDATVRLFGPSDVENSLTNVSKALVGKGLPNRCFINAGWNRTTESLKLPSGTSDFDFVNVAKAKKDQGASLIWISESTPPPDVPNILLFMNDEEGGACNFLIRTFDFRTPGIIAICDPSKAAK